LDGTGGENPLMSRHVIEFDFALVTASLVLALIIEIGAGWFRAVFFPTKPWVFPSPIILAGN
jgi:hypothetical protein